MSTKAENLQQNSDTVLSVECVEPEGTFIREVRPFLMTPVNIQKFYVRSKKYRTLLGHDVNGDYEKFLNIFVKEGPKGPEPTGLFWIVDEFVGVFFLTDIYPEQDALAHFAFLDGRYRGRHDLTKAMVRYAFHKYNFRRISAELPCYLREHSFKFAEEVGFVREGCKRQAVLYKEHWFDVRYYGILREEALNGF